MKLQAATNDTINKTNLDVTFDQLIIENEVFILGSVL